jgi:hypothetical protein
MREIGTSTQYGQVQPFSSCSMATIVKSTEMLAIAWPLGYDDQPYHPRRGKRSGRGRS